MEARRLIAVLVGMNVSWFAHAAQSTPKLVANTQVSYEPFDVAIAASEKFAVLRTGTFGTTSPYLGAVYFVALDPPYTLTTMSTSDADAFGVDFVATLGNYCITLGGSRSTTEIFQIDPPVFTAATGYSAWDVTTAYHPVTGVLLGIVEASPGGLTAFDLSSGGVVGGGGVPNFVDYLTPSGPHVYGDPSRLSDAVQASASRAIAITNRYLPATAGVVNEGYVGVSDFNGTPSLAHSFGFTCGPTATSCPTHADEDLHDVTVTPDGVHGIVSGNGVLGVYKLRTSTEAYKVIDHSTLPHMWFIAPPYSRTTVDSVEASETRAVIVGKDVRNNPVQDPPPPAPDAGRWRVTVVDLPVAQSGYTHVSFADTGTVPSRAHDVAITPNGAKAIVTTRLDTLVFDLTVPMHAVAPIPYVTAADPLQYAPNTSNAAFVSDSVATTDTKAVVIGRALPASTFAANVAVIDLLASPGPAAITTFTFPDGGFWWLPTDVAINGVGQYVLIRMVDLSTTSNNSRGRLVAIDLSTSQVTLDVQSAAPLNPSTLGMAQGFDQLECSFTRVFTAGERFNTAFAQIAWTQVLSFQ